MTKGKVRSFANKMNVYNSEDAHLHNFRKRSWRISVFVMMIFGISQRIGVPTPYDKNCTLLQK